jgi:hypothetical protein
MDDGDILRVDESLALIMMRIQCFDGDFFGYAGLRFPVG